MTTIRDEIKLVTKYGEARLFTFQDVSDGKEHLALAFGELGEAPVTRLHSECLTGDALGSLHCDCGPQLDQALKQMSREGGLLLYMRQEGRGIGLYNKIAAYKLQARGLDTFSANRALGFPDDARDFGVAAEMLNALGIKQIRLVTNNPEKVRALRASGIRVTETIHHRPHVCATNSEYLKAKRDAGHHLLLVENGGCRGQA